MEKVEIKDVNGILELLKIEENSVNLLFSLIIKNGGDLFADNLTSPSNCVAISKGNNSAAVVIGSSINWIKNVKKRIKFHTDLYVIKDYIEVKEKLGDEFNVRPVCIREVQPDYEKLNIKTENDIKSIAYVDMFADIFTERKRKLYFHKSTDEIYLSGKITGKIEFDEYAAFSYICGETEKFVLFDTVSNWKDQEKIMESDICLFREKLKDKKGVMLDLGDDYEYPIQEKYLMLSRVIAKI